MPRCTTVGVRSQWGHMHGNLPEWTYQCGRKRVVWTVNSIHSCAFGNGGHAVLRAFAPEAVEQRQRCWTSGKGLHSAHTHEWRCYNTHNQHTTSC